MPGRGPGKSAFPELPYRTLKNAGMHQMKKDAKDIITSLKSATDPNSFYRMITKEYSRILIYWTTKMLLQAAQRAPIATGELRESGTVNIYAGGQSHLTAEVSAAKADGSVVVKQNMDVISRNYTRLEAEISFYRVDKGMDIALWTHEQLLPWVPRPKTDSQKGKFYARTPGEWPQATGPKYLSKAVDFYNPDLWKDIRGATGRVIRRYNSIHGKKRGGRKR